MKNKQQDYLTITQTFSEGIFPDTIGLPEPSKAQVQDQN